MSVVDGLERVKGGSGYAEGAKEGKGKQRTRVIQRGRSDGEVR